MTPGKKQESTMPMNFYKFWWFSVVLVMLLLTYLSLAADVPEIDMDDGDKWAHILAYFLTMSWWGFVLRPATHWRIAIFLMLYGALMEVLQAAVGYRHFDVVDFIANSLGILLAFGALRFPHYQQLLVKIDDKLGGKNLP